MLNVIDFIKNNPNWRELLSKPPYCLRISDDGVFTLLKYSQLDSDFTNEIVRECRGLIIDDTPKPVCVPFFKFANYGESYADVIDWVSAKAEEKIDGSLIKLWNYGGDWHVSTNGVIDAAKAGIEDKHGNAEYKNYEELFRAAAEKVGLIPERLNPKYTYMFELVSPYNRVVVPYKDIDLYHIGTRDNETLKELDVDVGVKKPQTYGCGSLDEIIETAKALPYNREGYVSNFNYNTNPLICQSFCTSVSSRRRSNSSCTSLSI